jgi:hypothetical protein
MHVVSAECKMLPCPMHAQDEHLQQPTAGGAAFGRRIQLRGAVLWWLRIRLWVVAVLLVRPRSERDRRGRRWLRHAHSLLGTRRHRRSCQAVPQPELPLSCQCCQTRLAIGFSEGHRRPSLCLIRRDLLSRNPRNSVLSFSEIVRHIS